MPHKDDEEMTPSAYDDDASAYDDLKGRTVYDVRPVRFDCSVEMSHELRVIAAKFPGLKVTTVGMMALRAGLPLVRAQLAEAASVAAKELLEGK